jgi:hypothetical protein
MPADEEPAMNDLPERHRRRALRGDAVACATTAFPPIARAGLAGLMR